MCLRLPCSGNCLRTSAIVVGVVTVLQTIALICIGGYFIYESLLTGNFGTNNLDRLPYKFDYIRALGACYLAFGAVWLLVTMTYWAALISRRAMYFLPWLVVEAISIGLGIANMIVAAASYREYAAFGVVPLFLISMGLYTIVFSYYLELQEEKNFSQAPYRPRVNKF